MSDEFLLKEYSCCYEQLRFYDTRSESILKYLFSLTSAVGTAQFAIYKFINDFSQGFYLWHFLLSIIVFIATLLLLCSLVQNRLYFVYTARQLNAIRGYWLTRIPDFRDNQLYTSTDFPALKTRSVHTFIILGAAFLSSLFAASSIYSFGPAFNAATGIRYAIGALAGVFLLEVTSCFLYLYFAGKKTADEAIHHKKPD